METPPSRKKFRVDALQPEVQEEEAEIVEPAIPEAAPKENGKPAPDAEAIKLFGDLGFHD